MAVSVPLRQKYFVITESSSLDVHRVMTVIISYQLGTGFANGYEYAEDQRSGSEKIRGDGTMLRQSIKLF